VSETGDDSIFARAAETVCACLLALSLPSTDDIVVVMMMLMMLMMSHSLVNYVHQSDAAASPTLLLSLYIYTYVCLGDIGRQLKHMFVLN